MTACYKHPTEVRTYTFDFSAQQEILAGETLSLPTVTATLVSGTSPATLTIATPSVSSGTVRVKLSSGTDNDTYVMTCTVKTSGGHTLVGKGQLLITTKL